MTTTKDKVEAQKIKDGINKSCTFLYDYKTARIALGENFDLDVRVYFCPCGKLSITDAKDNTGRNLDYTGIYSDQCGF